MADVKIGYSDYVRYYLKSEYSASLKIQEPIGWDEDAFGLERHKDYHGIFYSFTNDLQFEGEEKDYIETAYKIGGINTDLRLTKYERLVVNGEIKWKKRYTALADFNQKVIKDGKLTVKFNNLNLAELLKSHETDDFEIERKDTIDGLILEPVEINKALIEGRGISISGEATFLPRAYSNQYSGSSSVSPMTQIISIGPDRHEPVQMEGYDDLNDITADNMIYANAVFEDIDREVTVNYEMNFRILNCISWWTLNIALVEYDETTGNYFSVEHDEILIRTYAVDGIAGMAGAFSASGTYKKTLNYKQGLLIYFRFGGDNWDLNFANSPRSFYTLNETSFYEASPNLSFIFHHDLMQRLMYIITGKKDAFYSKYFGRTEKGYVQNGPGGLIGNISGFWLRAFDPISKRYKSLTTSIKDLIESDKAVFNIGVGIESNEFGERVRFEDLKYFYRNEVVVKFPLQVNNVVRKTDSSLFFSGLELGYELGGDYEDSNGLDECNTNVKWITPIRKSENKFVKKSKIRSDEYGSELTRRKPQSQFPDEDTNRDDNIWFLDLQETDGIGYRQRKWNEGRLEEEPKGIFDPNSWHGAFFTPQQMLFRHAWIFRGGMEPYLNKYIKYGSSGGNKNVEIWIKDNPKKYKQSDDILTGDTERSRFLPELIECEHPIDDVLMDWILGTTEVMVEGQMEKVPNYYFKMQFINENGKTERGYLMSLKPEGKGKLIFQKANENII